MRYVILRATVLRPPSLEAIAFTFFANTTLLLFIFSCISLKRAYKHEIDISNHRNRSQHTTDESKQHPGKECGVDNMYASINKPVYQGTSKYNSFTVNDQSSAKPIS